MSSEASVRGEKVNVIAVLPRVRTDVAPAAEKVLPGAGEPAEQLRRRLDPGEVDEPPETRAAVDTVPPAEWSGAVRVASGTTPSGWCVRIVFST